MSTLEEFINVTLSNNGVRVSSRLPIRERLMRAIDISCRSSGIESNSTDLETIASLILMRYSSLPHPSKWNIDILDTLTQPDLSKSCTTKALPSLTPTISVDTQVHPMIRRSQLSRK